MNAAREAREARQHGRRGAASPAAPQALYQTKLHRVELWSLPAGPKFSAGRGDMFPDCIRARMREAAAGQILSKSPPIYDHLPGAEEFRDPGGIPTKTAFARGGMKSRFHSVDMVHKRISVNSFINFIKQLCKTPL